MPVDSSSPSATSRPPAEYLDFDPLLPAPEKPFTALVLRGGLSGNE